MVVRDSWRLEIFPDIRTRGRMSPKVPLEAIEVGVFMPNNLEADEVEAFLEHPVLVVLENTSVHKYHFDLLLLVIALACEDYETKHIPTVSGMHSASPRPLEVVL